MTERIDRLLRVVDEELVDLLREVVAEAGPEMEPSLEGLHQDLSLFTLPRLRSLPRREAGSRRWTSRRRQADRHEDLRRSG